MIRLIVVLLQISLTFASSAEAKEKSAGTFMPRHCDEKAAQLRAKELKALFQADQDDRAPMEGRAPLIGDPVEAMKKADEGDFQRRRRSAEIFAEGCLRSADDYYHAAMIFQHGNVPDHFLQAHLWASRSARLGKKEARWLSAASLDRYLMNLGYKQIYATQARTQDGSAEGCWCLWPVEEAVSEQKRLDYGVKTLKEQLAWIGEINKSKNGCSASICRDKAKTPSPEEFSGLSW